MDKDSVLFEALTGYSAKKAFNDSVLASGEAVTEKVQDVIQTAKEAVTEVKVTVGKVVEKAIPASIAACASLQYTGAQGSFASFLNPVNFRSKYFLLDGERSDFVGWPCNNVLTLSTLSGFCQCKDAKIALNATIDEQQLVKQYMEGGFYIE